MSLRGKWSVSAAALALGVAGLVGGASASTTSHPPAGRASWTPFELTLIGTLTLPPAWHEAVPGYTSEGTFQSGAPFCAAGSFVDVDPVRFEPHIGSIRRFTCDDGSGSLTVSTGSSLVGELVRQEPSIWHIRSGTGSYADLRGDGYQRGEVLGGDSGFFEGAFEGLGGTVRWRNVFEGYVDRDVVAPTITLSRPTVTKLARPVGAYAIDVEVALRDDVVGNAVSYTLRVTTTRGVELWWSFGRATNQAVPLTLHIRQRRPTAVLLLLDAEDPNGNASSLTRRLKLPR